MSAAQIDLNDAITMDRWERIIKIENLQADTALKLAQTKVVVWQVVAASFTAGAAVAGAVVAIGHWT